MSNIRPYVDGIYAIWQKKSYCGNDMDPVDMEELQRLKKIGLLDDLVEFVPDLGIDHRVQETAKRNMSIDYVKSKGYSHVLQMDGDECYDTKQFKNAKDFISKKGFPITYCQYVNIYKYLDYYLLYPFVPYVNFIHSTYFKYTYNCAGCGEPTDPTRRINNPMNLGTYLFKPAEIRMVHLSWVRRNIRKKLENWSAKSEFKQELIDKAVDRFNNWKEGDNVIQLFNVPDNQVLIKKLDKRLCDINIPWLEEEQKEWKLKNNYV
jgi:hypothetical protein